jgi:hypothetical protein
MVTLINKAGNKMEVTVDQLFEMAKSSATRTIDWVTQIAVSDEKEFILEDNILPNVEYVELGYIRVAAIFLSKTVHIRTLYVNYLFCDSQNTLDTQGNSPVISHSMNNYKYIANEFLR